MKYSKPEVKLLMPAIGIIRQTCQEKNIGFVDALGCSDPHNTNAAYEADE